MRRGRLRVSKTAGRRGKLKASGLRDQLTIREI
jgi:hypothetical protein